MKVIDTADRLAGAFGAEHGPQLANQLLSRPSARIAPSRARGRASGINPSGRFEAFSHDVFDDGWNSFEDLPPFKTDVQVERARTIITRNSSPDISFNRSINPYRGCEHGCVYCFARPSHAYQGMSAGLDFESRLFVKPDAAQLLEAEITRPGYKMEPIAIGTNTDPYQPIEREWMVMRAILEVLERHNHPVGIVTKSALILRDKDILERMAAKRLVKVALSVTTMDRRLARTMEPRASTPSKRLEAVKALSDAGIPTSVMVAPIIPGLNDHEIERILDAAAGLGATHAGYVLLRLPLDVAPVFKEWLLRHYPERYRHVMSLIRSMRGGRDYDAEWGKRMRGTGPYAVQIGRRFELAAKRYGLSLNRQKLNTDLFKAPKADQEQLALL
ncbi:MAG: PA0069 family radical SAM protein [Ahrensia sp.]